MPDRICFVILHYGDNVDLTINAVKSVQKLNGSERADIVVVCNGKNYNISKKADPKDLQSVDILLLDENKGFSAGNNVGYRYAKEKDNYAFMVVMNNDIVIEQKDFIDKVFSIYAAHPFYVCGPDVYIPYIGVHSNPMRNHVYSYQELDEFIALHERRNQEFAKKFSTVAFKFYLREGFSGRRLLSKIYEMRARKRNTEYMVPAENVVLHGACFIFSNSFILKNEKAFEPEVFLYFEEDYLAKKCIENNWPMYYTPDLRVLHFHRGSSGLSGMKYREFCNKRIQINIKLIAGAEEAKKRLY